MLKKIIGSRNDRLIKRMRRTVTQINALSEELEGLSDSALRDRTDKFREDLAKGAKVNDLLVPAFATVREAGRRVLNMRHFDVQLIGGMVLNDGKISEMRTGEGKTLVATLAAYLNALEGKGVHVVTVNDYLATRDSSWMGQLYEGLGLSTGCIVSNMRPVERREAYAADITYGTNNEFGFDYLRDNMAFSRADRVQRGQNFAIVDEVDSILIDEARTPLIISGPTEDRSDLYVQVDQLVPRLKKQEQEDGPGDFSVDEKTKQVFLTESGHEHVEQLLVDASLLEPDDSLYSSNNIKLMHHINAALRARILFQRDVDYVVQGGQVIIVDEFTGRTMPGRRWSEGLHQAVEAKEGVQIQQENQTLASITFQNYFRLYDKLSGMTGTADTEAFEFQQIYGLEVVVVPTHKAMVRDDRSDLVFLTQQEKFEAILEEIQDCQRRRQPVLVGTTSIETSEMLSQRLAQSAVEHKVLNAKFHEQEAQIIAEAGRPGAVTVATNMAGRGTDIVLGGSLELGEDEGHASRPDWQRAHEEVLESGGLHVIGTERHESRRIDNQLRGRSGRQGDAGSSRFFLSLDDNLMRIFASDRVAGLMQKLGMEEGEAIEHPWVNKAIENAQRKVEGRNFDIRKQLLEFDDVANDQRRVVYHLRDELLETEDVSEKVTNIREEVVSDLVAEFVPPESFEENWDVDGLAKALEKDFGLPLPIAEWIEQDDSLHEETLVRKVQQSVTSAYAEKEQRLGAELMRQVEKGFMLQVLDSHWKEHLASMDHLRQGIHLRGYAQKNPKQEYKREAFELFEQMLKDINRDVIGILSRVELQAPPELESQKPADDSLQYQHPETPDALGGDEAPPPEPQADAAVEPARRKAAPVTRSAPKVGRNAPCPCGSGKKYKQCHGRLT